MQCTSLVWLRVCMSSGEGVSQNSLWGGNPVWNPTGTVPRKAKFSGISIFMEGFKFKNVDYLFQKVQVKLWANNVLL